MTIRFTFPADTPDATHNRLLAVFADNCQQFFEVECDDDNSLTITATGANRFLERRVREVFNCQANVWKVEYLKR